MALSTRSAGAEDDDQTSEANRSGRPTSPMRYEACERQSK